MQVQSRSPVFSNETPRWLRDGQRFIVRADEKLTAFVELQGAIRKLSFAVSVGS
jgi:hypothetical protein